MRAILLAAGRGTRISKSIEDVPKCTLPVEGVPLIRRTVEMLIDRGVTPVVCLGYRPYDVRGALQGLPVTFYHNPFYDVTNSIASLWFAQEELRGDTVVMNGDVFLSPRLLDKVLDDSRDVVMMSDSSRIEEGDYFFGLNEEGHVTQYGKDLTVDERSAEYVGLARLSSSIIPQFVERMNELVAGQRHGAWWEDILYSFVPSGPITVETLDTGDEFWSEIDFIDDYDRILDYLGEERA